jgi:hypothetical protein
MKRIILSALFFIPIEKGLARIDWKIVCSPSKRGEGLVAFGG